MALGTLTIDLAANTARLASDLGRASQMSKRYNDDLGKQAMRAGKIVGGALAAGAVAAAAGVAVLVQQQRDAIDQQAKLAQQLRTTYESMANLERAGGMAGVGMEKIISSSRQLEQRLAQAVQGSKAQAEAFAQIGLSAEEISRLPLDQRIAAINEALRSNVRESERAAVAGKIFGEEGATIMQALNPETISEAARQVELFGLNLSDVDAAKVEMANDAMGTFGMLTDGAAKQLTVQLAPILKAIGDEFLRSAEEAGGMGNMVERAVERTVSALSFVVDAGDGVTRVFSIVADTIIGVLVTGQYRVTELVATMLSALDKIPGVDLSLKVESLERSANQARLVAQEAAKNIRQTLEQPLAGERMRQGFENAKAAAQAAAEATVASRSVAEPAMERIAAASDKAAKATKSAVDQLQQAYDSQLEGYERRLALINATTEAETLSYEVASGKLVGINAEQQKRLELLAAELDMQAALKKQAEEQARIDTEATQVLDSLKSEEDRLAESYEKRKQIILDSTIATEEAKHEILAALDEQRNEKLLEMEAQRTSVMLQNAQQGFDALAGLTETFAGKQSGIYKVMFAASKAFALADAIVKIQAGIANAAILPFPANLGAMATVAASTAGIVSTISGTEMAGARRYGGAVNAGQLYEVGENNRPEMFVAGGRQFMIPGNRGEVVPGGDMGRSSVVNQTINVSGVPDHRTASQMQRSAARQQRVAQSRFG